MTGAPDERLLWSGFDQHVVPVRVEGDLRSLREYDVVSAGVEIAHPPRLVGGVIGQGLDHSLLVQLRADRCVVRLWKVA